jgi:hypothetical protein
MANAIQWGFLAAIAAGFVVFLTLILTVFDMTGAGFILGLTFLLGMLFASSVGMGGAYRNKRWGWLLMVFLSLIVILFAFALYLMVGQVELHGVMIASSIILFAIAIINMGLADNVEEPQARKKPQIKVYESMEKVEPYHEGKAVAKVAAPKKRKLPGRFVASKMASHYHTPRCEWTPNIKRRNRIWFGSEASAKKAKFKPHECIK